MIHSTLFLVLGFSPVFGAQTLIVGSIDKFPVEVPQLFVKAPVIIGIPEEVPEARDCRNAVEVVDSIDRLAFPLRARYWAMRIAAGESRQDAFEAALARIRSRYQRHKLDFEVRELSTSVWTKSLSPSERQALEELEWESRRLRRLCGFEARETAKQPFSDLRPAFE